MCFVSDRTALSARHEAVNEQHDDRTDYRADQSRALTRTIPTEGLAKVSRYECADNS